MVISRVSQQQLVRSAQSHMQSSMSELARLQVQASTQKAVTRPSDDPSGTANSLRVRSELRANQQYQRNIDDGAGWLSTVDSALATTTSLLNRVRDLTVQGANDGVLSPAAKQAIAMELRGVKEDLLNQANTTYLGRTIFAGTSDSGTAFDFDPVGGGYIFNGGAGSVERRISPTAKVTVDADGAAVFGLDDATVPSQSIFSVIDAIVDRLTGAAPGGSISSFLPDIDRRMESVREQQAMVGTRHAQIQRAEEINMEQAGALEIQRSGIEDVDLAEVILDLRMQEVAYNATLAVSARVLPMTLLDFLR